MFGADGGSAPGRQGSLKSVVLITADLVLRNRLERLLADSFRVVLFGSIQSSLDYVYSSMPDLMIVESMVINDSRTRAYSMT